MIIKTTVTNAAPIRMSMLPGDLRQHWKRCGMTADFLGQSAASFQPRATTIISTVINELLENAIKYSATDEAPIDVALSVQNDTVHCEIKNWAKFEDANSMDSYFKAIETQDIDELYFLQLEKSATTTDHHSKMGLLGVIHDYPVTLGCQIRSTSDQLTPFQISINATINLSEVHHYHG
ncbi:hypothetical protein EBR57_02975 [bacterium]|nr:hypothetical protein [bacterium]